MSGATPAGDATLLFYLCAKCGYRTRDKEEAERHKASCGGIIVEFRRFGTVV